MLTLGFCLAWSGLVGGTTQESVDHGAWDRILQQHVHEERVDYLGIRRDAWQELEAYLAALATVDLESLSAPDQLAFALNLYNATMVQAIVRRMRVGTTVAADGWGVFDEPLVRMQGGRRSLNQLEHELIRPRFQDPRIHVALVCGARSCPPLLARAYRAGDLDEVLDANLRRFLEDGSRNARDPVAKELRLSRIFEWYAEDFGGPDALLPFVAKHLGEDLSGWRLGPFLEYSWDLNLLPPRRGRWVSVTEDGTALVGEEGAFLADARAGDLFEVRSADEERWRVRRPFGLGDAWLAKDRAKAWPAQD